ncbi:MAG: hypothetical protein K1X64_02670 [Myxococcaceae bacterium]|nr:hypothetical protein [Myxococcaceae bacterium]
MFTSKQESLAFETEDPFAHSAAVATCTLSNERIAAGLEEIARLLPYDVRNQGRRRMLNAAAGLIRTCHRPVQQLIEDDGVEGLHRLGIIYEIGGVVSDWVRTGQLPWLERLRAQRREELLHIPGIGARLAQELRELFGVVDLDGLAEVARSGKLANACGFGPKRVKLVSQLLSSRGLTT